MKAVVYTGKGMPDGLALKQVEKPMAGDHEVLIRVRAATVTPSDKGGMAFVMLSRLFRGFSRQSDAVPGVEFAGVIEEAGNKVRHFKAGDRVYGSAGTSFGAWAEYILMPGDGVLALMPGGMSFDEAAGICDGMMTAHHFLVNKAKMEKGQNVLINGASGSVGTCAVQLARLAGCRVTGVCGSAHAELVRSLGAHKVIDYSKEDFLSSGERYDIVFDTVAKGSFARCKKVLTPYGVYLTTAPSPGIFLAMLLTRIGGGKRALFSPAGLAKRKVKARALRLIGKLLNEGKLQAVVDRRYPLEQIRDALKYVGQGHKKGSVVIAPE